MKIIFYQQWTGSSLFVGFGKFTDHKFEKYIAVSYMLSGTLIYYSFDGIMPQELD